MAGNVFPHCMHTRLTSKTNKIKQQNTINMGNSKVYHVHVFFNQIGTVTLYWSLITGTSVPKQRHVAVRVQASAF